MNNPNPPLQRSMGRRATNALVASLLSISLAVPPGLAHEPTDYSALFDQASPSVVSVNSVTVLEGNGNAFPYFFFGIPPNPGDGGPGSPHRSSGVGSGVILSQDGYIMTNAHVILEADAKVADKIEVITHDKHKLAAEVIGYDIYSDIALLKVEFDQPLPAAQIGDSNDIKVGNSVVAIGHPLGLNYTLTSGIISSLNRSLTGGGGTERFVPFIQTDAAINPGNSGGPLLNTDGEVIGINSRIIGGRAGSYIGYSLAIPINLAMDVQAKLRQNGTIRRGMLGVTFDAEGIDEDDAKVWGLSPGQDGVLVNSVIEGTGAAAAGIEPGDVIISFDNKPIKEAADFPRFIADTEPGSVVSVDLIREGSSLRLDVTIGDIEVEGKLAASGEIPDLQPYGMVLEDVPDTARSRLGVTGGVLLKGFDDGGDKLSVPQELYKLRGGDVILGVIIEGKLTQVEGPTDLRRLLTGLTIDTIGFQVVRGRSQRPFFVTVNLAN